MPTLLLVRHGQASYGAADYDVLSDRGRRQATVLADDLARRGIVPDLVVAGSLNRQVDTAEPIARIAGRTVEVDPRWNEYDADDILAHHSDTGAQIEGDAAPPSSRDFQHLLDGALTRWIEAGAGSPANETWTAFDARSRAALQAVVDRLGSGETGLVVSSGGTIGGLCAAAMGMAPAGLVTFNRVAVNTGIARVVCGRQGITLVSFNEQAHLDGGDVSLRTYR